MSLLLNEIRDFRMFKITINNKKVCCYWDVIRREYQFFRCKQQLNNNELKEMKNLIRKKLDEFLFRKYFNNPIPTVLDSIGLEVYDTINGEIVKLFKLGTKENTVFIELSNKDIVFRYLNQLRLLNS